MFFTASAYVKAFIRDLFLKKINDSVPVIVKN
jgi:hypothetical protein